MKKTFFILAFFVFATNSILAQWQPVTTPNNEITVIDGENKILSFKSKTNEFISTDEGVTWKNLLNLPSSGACDSQDSVFFINGNGFRLENGKLLKTCSFLPPGTSYYETEYNNIPYFQKKAVNNQYGKINFTKDNTKSWEEFSLPENQQQFRTDLYVEKNQMAGASYNVFADQYKFNIHYSGDHGVNWSKSLYNVGTYSSGGSGQKLNALLLLGNEIVVAGENGGGLLFINYVTKNSRKTNAPLVFKKVVKLNNTLFAQIDYQVLYSTDKGLTWIDITDNLSVTNSIDAMNIVNNKLYVYVKNSKVFVRNIGNLSSEKNTIAANDDLQIFPNPSADKIHIQLNNNDLENCNVVVFDILGKQIFQQKSNNPIDISSFSKGLYFLKISQNEKSWIRKFEKM